MTKSAWMNPITGSPDHPTDLLLLAPPLSALRALTRSRLSGIEGIPVHDGIEPQRISALRLPAPEWTDREHHDMSLAQGNVGNRSPIRQRLAIGKRAGKQHVIGIRRELHDDS